MIVDAKNDPASVWRIGTHEGANVTTLVMRYHAQVRSVWMDGRNVCRFPGDKNVSILREGQVPAVRRPVLFDRNIETEGSKLNHVAAVDAGGEERGSDRLTIAGDKAEFLAVRGNVWIDATWADTLPVGAAEVHAPKRFVVCREIDSIEYNSRPVRCERGIALADIRVWRKINQAAAIGVHDRYIAGIRGIV